MSQVVVELPGGHRTHVPLQLECLTLRVCNHVQDPFVAVDAPRLLHNS